MGCAYNKRKAQDYQVLALLYFLPKSFKYNKQASIIYQSSKTIDMLAFAFNNTTVNINPLLAIKIHFYRYDSRRTKEREWKSFSNNLYLTFQEPFDTSDIKKEKEE